MMLQALLGVVPVRGEMDRAALAAHGAMLEHGFVCTGASEPTVGAAPLLVAGADGSVVAQVVPPGWNAVPDSYTFGYVHPLRGATEAFTMKALAIGESLAVHAASNVASAELLTVTLKVDRAAADGDPASVAARAREWQEKTTTTVALRLLGRHNSTARLGRALEGESVPPVKAGSAGAKRPAPAGDDRTRNTDEDDPRFRPGPGHMDPFNPGFFGEGRPLLWTPDGGLLGPRHPAWGQVVPPGRGSPIFPGGGGGLMPRFDPIGPGLGDPDPDHLPVPGVPGFPGGLGGGGFPGSGRGRGGRMDPDNMFIM
mmetsp:Transcript_54593/g.119502  ORF Transcript_54593/g.119502 Transcript_54593/m.119502 type:complete len:312 (+) Transcript_54593:179-1114(+)